MSEPIAEPVQGAPSRLESLKSTIDECLLVLHATCSCKRYFPPILVEMSELYREAIYAIRVLIDAFEKSEIVEAESDVEHESNIVDLENFTNFLCSCEQKGLVLKDYQANLYALFPDNGPLCSVNDFRKHYRESEILGKIDMMKEERNREAVHTALIDYVRQLDIICENPIFPDRSPYSEGFWLELIGDKGELSHQLSLDRSSVVGYEMRVILRSTIIRDMYERFRRDVGAIEAHEEELQNDLVAQDEILEDMDHNSISMDFLRQILDYCGLLS